MAWNRLDPLARFTPAGPQWTKLRHELYSDIDGIGWGQTPACYYCSHPVMGADHGVVAHVISPKLRPDLAWARSNLRPAHDGRPRRCEICGLACNWLAHNSPDALYDGDKSLPFDRAFMARRGLPPPRHPDPLPVRIPAKPGRPW
jgi:hypothetical protein